MTKIEETLTKAYGNVPREPVVSFNFDFEITRPIKFYWLKFFRKFIGR